MLIPWTRFFKILKFGQVANWIRGLFASKITKQSIDISDKISGLAKKLNIYSGQKTLNPQEGAEIVEKYFQQMKLERFAEKAAGFIDKSGRIIVTDGNHKMNAALKYAIEIGDNKYVESLINNGNFIKNIDLKDYGIKIYNLPTK